MKTILPLVFLVLSLPLFAQTTYYAPTGNITSTFITTMQFDVGGSAVVYDNFPNCYYPGPCGSTNSRVTYSLSDGSTASFYPVSLSFTSISGTYYGDYLVTSLGNLTATDSFGHPVTVTDIHFTLHTQRCIQPRGTCPPKKVYNSGSMTVE